MLLFDCRLQLLFRCLWGMNSLSVNWWNMVSSQVPGTDELLM